MTTYGFRMRLIAVPVLLLTALAGCAGKEDRPQVASAGGGPSAGPSAPADQAAKGREFARCMRAEGIEMPDPGPDGMVAMPAGRVDDKAGMQKMEAALEKCREFLPDGGEPPKATAEDLAKAREYAKCVREHGLPGFPDPDPETGQFRLGPGQSDDMKDLAKASENCRQFGAGVMPGIEVSK
jgi:hypothetical protein